MYLRQASASDELSAMVLNQLYKYAPVFNYLHFFSAPGAGTTERYGDDIDGTFDNRPIGEDFASQTLAPNYGTFALKIMGKNIKLDTAYEERGGDVPSEFKLKLSNWGENAGRDFMNKVINDDSDDDDGGDPAVSEYHFDGLKAIIADQVSAGDTSRIVSAGTNGLALVLGNDNTARTAAQKAIEKIEELIASIDGSPDCLIMDHTLLSRLRSMDKERFSVVTNADGTRTGAFDGLPIIPASRKYNGDRIIPYDETVGTATTCTSVYAFKSAEKAHLSAMTTTKGFNISPMQKVGNFYQVTPQLQLDIQPLAKRCVARLKGFYLG